MSVEKNEFPILEYDSDYRSIIMPNHEKRGMSLPKKAIFAFLGDYIDKFAEDNGFIQVSSFLSITKNFPIYVGEYKGESVSLVQAPVGSSPASQILDWLIAYGAKEIISTGSCGALEDFPENTFLVPIRALRDEGASYHYLKPSRFIDINKRALKAIEKTINDHGLNYREVVTWTTDGFYRETKEMVLYRKEEGCSVVEMECSALAAVAQMRGATLGQILFTADTLANIEKYDPRNWGGDSFEYALKLCFDTLINMR